jgi:hypothetical protein
MVALNFKKCGGRILKNVLFYVGGSKGGVGKSLLSLTLVQYLIDKYGDIINIHLIETDDSNPDVGRVYRGSIPVSTAILDENVNGWLRLSKIIEENPNSLFVVNSAARSNLGIIKHGPNFSTTLEDNSILCDLITFFPINRQKDSVLLLCDYLRAINFGKVYVVRNNHFGNPEDFTLFSRYFDKEPILQQRITSILDFPGLSDIIANDFHESEKTIPEVITADPPIFGAFARQCFKSWYEKISNMFENTGMLIDKMKEDQ